jgi:RNA ligase (TIGR02306 family)
MSNFEVKVQKIFISDHPNAERLDIGHVGHPTEGHQVVVAKGRLVTGDLVAYVPENGLVPEWVLKKYGYWDGEKQKGLLAGSKGDRVKAVKLRDAFSVGIVIKIENIGEAHFIGSPEGEYSWTGTLEDQLVVEGWNVADLLGITKYEAPIPTQLAGEVYNAGQELTLNYDIENIKSFPNAFEDGEEVEMTEKIHGTNCCITYIPIDSPYVNDNHLTVTTSIEVDGNFVEVTGQFAVASKGLGAQGLCFKWNDQNSGNLYQKVVRKYFEQILAEIFIQEFQDKVIMIYGEVYGNGVQTNFNYGLKQNVQDFRIFDIYVGIRGHGNFLASQSLSLWCNLFGIPRVPLLYRGPFDMAKIATLIQNQKSTFDPNQIIEGGVIKSVVERYVQGLGRLNLKYLNEKYLLLKNNSEYQ